MSTEPNRTAVIAWRSVLGIVMVLAGCGCFILSCVSAMIMVGKS